MSAPLIIPFNYMPIATVVGSTGSYTVPSGKYARIVVTLSARAYGTITLPGSSSGTTAFSVSSSGNGVSIEFFLKSGDVLTTSTSIASGQNGASSASVSVNSSVIANCFAQSSAYYALGGVAQSAGSSGDAYVGYIASEYYIIS